MTSFRDIPLVITEKILADCRCGNQIWFLTDGRTKRLFECSRCGEKMAVFLRHHGGPHDISRNTQSFFI